MHFLCGDTFDGEQAFPGADLQLASQRDNLMAARLLESGEADAGAAMARAMAAKTRLAQSLRGRKGNVGCKNCSKAVLG